MTDILDNLSDLEDELDEETLGEEIVLVEDEPIVVDENLDELTESEALELTAAICSTMTATYVLLNRAHEGKAYKALGYDTWKDYVSSEFDFSVQRSYQLLNLASTIKMIEEATPEGTEVVLTEAQARDIKRELPRITEKVQEETAGKDPETAADIATRVVDEAREQAKADEKALAEKEKKQAQADEDAAHAELESQADALLEPDTDSVLTDNASGDYSEVEVSGEGTELSQRDSLSLYNFFNILEGFKSLPEPHEMLNLVPQEREEQVESALLEITGWFNSFHTLWDERETD